MISEEDKERVRAATDLVALVGETVELRPRNGEFWGCCPFHGEKTPSFHIIPSTQSWHCFGCGAGGDCFTYVMRRENLSFPEAIRYLADRAGIEIADDGPTRERGTKRTRLVQVCEETAAFYHTMLMRGKDSRPREYFASRGFGSAVCRRYRLGFAPGRGALVAHLRSRGFTPREMIDANVAVSRGRGLSDRFYERVMFPIMDEQGRCIAFGGRIMGQGQPKYLNTAETALFHKKRNLYAFNWAKEHIVAEACAIVTEGYTDVIACHEAGIKNVVATLGTALTEHHVKTLTRFAKKVIYLFDGDEAGQRAAERAIQFVEKESVDLRCVILPDNLDPMEFVSQRGADALRELLDQAQPLMDFVFRRLMEKSDTSTPGGRAKALEDACRLLYPLRQSYMIDSYYQQVADILGINPEMVRESSQRVWRDVQRAEAQNRRREEARALAEQQRTRPAGPAPASGSAAYAAPAGEGEYVPYGDADAYVDEGYPGEDGSGAPAPAPSAASGGGSGAVPLEALTEVERHSLRSERELLCLMTAFPDEFRPFAERITQVRWIDPRDEAIAWAVLATPEGTPASDVMAAARAVCPEAAELVSAGTISATSRHPTETNIAFTLDTLELYGAQRERDQALSRLRSDHALSSEDRRALTEQAAQLTLRIRALSEAAARVADPFADLA